MTELMQPPLAFPVSIAIGLVILAYVAVVVRLIRLSNDRAFDCFFSLVIVVISIVLVVGKSILLLIIVPAACFLLMLLSFAFIDRNW